MKQVNIGTCIATPESIQRGRLPISGTDDYLDIAIMQGSLPGPTGFVFGGMHGNEINGPALVEKVLNTIDPTSLRGTLIFVPIMNRSGFYKSSRKTIEDDQDLNRSFGPDNGTFSGKVAKTIREEIIVKSDYGIDCHDAGGLTALLPHPRVHVDALSLIHI